MPQNPYTNQSSGGRPVQPNRRLKIPPRPDRQGAAEAINDARNKVTQDYMGGRSGRVPGRRDGAPVLPGGNPFGNTPPPPPGLTEHAPDTPYNPGRRDPAFGGLREMPMGGKYKGPKPPHVDPIVQVPPPHVDPVYPYQPPPHVDPIVPPPGSFNGDGLEYDPWQRPIVDYGPPQPGGPYGGINPGGRYNTPPTGAFRPGTGGPMEPGQGGLNAQPMGGRQRSVMPGTPGFRGPGVTPQPPMQAQPLPAPYNPGYTTGGGPGQIPAGGFRYDPSNPPTWGAGGGNAGGTFRNATTPQPADPRNGRSGNGWGGGSW